IITRDPTMDAETTNDDEHGSALDRVSAFQMGFITGASACAGINTQEIAQRRGDLPKALQFDPDGNPETGEVPINEDTLSTLMDLLGKVSSPKNAPTLSFHTTPCPDAKPSPPASYCPATNTIMVDLAGLAALGKVSDEKEHTLPQGDDTALSILMS